MPNSPNNSSNTNLNWQRRYEFLAHHRLTIISLGLCLILALLGIYNLILPEAHNDFADNLRTITSLLGLILVVVGFTVIWRDFVEPLLHLREWVLRMRGGDLKARIPVPKHGEFSELIEDINSLGEMLHTLAQDTEQQLQLHTAHTTQKTRSLAILYDVAASINASRDINDLLTRFLHTLKEVIDARAAAVRLVNDLGEMRLVASLGLDDDMKEREQIVPSNSCLCGLVANDSEQQNIWQNDMLPCGKILGRPFFSEDEDNKLGMIAVPLQYRDRTLGVYNLFVDQETIANWDDYKELFISIGRHLGMAIEKARLDDEANRLSIMEERTRLANELHDSLAQTLVSMRFQVRVLDETLHQEDEASTWQELERIENTLDEANTELRELIAHFRAPMDKRGLIPAVEQVIQRFRSASTIPIFLQKEWPNINLPIEVEMQVLRIVQETLVNIRKHSQAKAVRVFLSGDNHGQFRILVEDDGVGISSPSGPNAQGEHLGLTIMKDRAKRIGGELQIESERGEGTRVVLTFDYPNKTTPNSLTDFNRKNPYEFTHSGH